MPAIKSYTLLVRVGFHSSVGRKETFVPTVDVCNKFIQLPVVSALTGEQLTVWDASSRKNVPQWRTIWNPPFAWLHPDKIDDVIVLDWEPVWDEHNKQLKREFARMKAEGGKPKGFAAELKRRCLESINTPVVFHGRKFLPQGWGSGAKDKQTLGFAHNYPKTDGLVTVVEDLVRVARAWFPNGMYGGGVVKARVLLAPHGQLVGDHMVADGCGLITKELFDELSNKQFSAIELSDGQQNYQIWQRFEWTAEFEKEFDKSMEMFIDHVKNYPATMAAVYGEVGEFKRALLAADPAMIHHPLYSAQFLRKPAEILNTVGTTMYVPGEIAVAAPANYDFFVIQQKGKKFLIVRWPVDAPSNVQAVEVKLTELYKAERARMKSIHGMIQHTTTNAEITAKGCSLIVDRQSADWDFCLCVEDIKVVKGVHNIEKWREENSGKVVELEFFLSITQYYDKKSIFFAPIGRWKKMGGDMDGDMGFIMCVDHLKEVFRQALKWKDQINSYKIPKSRTNDFSMAGEYLYRSWLNGVGFAVNLQNSTFFRQPGRRLEIVYAVLRKVPRAFDFLEGREPTVEDLDYITNRLVKMFTDVFKTMAVDFEEEDKFMRAIQFAVTSLSGGTPAWELWRRSDVAFRTMVPGFRSELSEEYLERAKKDAEIRREPEYRIHISDECREATIARIYEKMRPWVTQQYNRLKALGTYDLVEAFKVAPLSDYVNWAPPVSDYQLLLAKEMIDAFVVLQTSVDWSRAESVQRLKDAARAMGDILARDAFGGNRRYCGYALWRASHHSRSNRAGASGVFTMMPEEALYIVRNKPGLFEGKSERLMLGEDVAALAKRMGTSVGAIAQMNNGVTSFESGDYVVLPRSGYTCNLIGTEYNFDGNLGSEIGPFTGSIVSGEFQGRTRLFLVSDETLLHQTGSSLHPRAVGLVPRVDYDQELKGESAPPAGRYVVMMYRMDKVFKAHFAPI